jgi:hypothetical protein
MSADLEVQTGDGPSRWWRAAIFPDSMRHDARSPLPHVPERPYRSVRQRVGVRPGQRTVAIAGTTLVVLGVLLTGCGRAPSATSKATSPAGTLPSRGGHGSTTTRVPGTHHPSDSTSTTGAPAIQHPATSTSTSVTTTPTTAAPTTTTTTTAPAQANGAGGTPSTPQTPAEASIESRIRALQAQITSLQAQIAQAKAQDNQSLVSSLTAQLQTDERQLASLRGQLAAG